VRAANRFPQALQTVFEGIYGAGSTTKIKQGAMQFAAWTLRNASDAVLTPIGPVMLSGLLKFLNTMPAGRFSGSCHMSGTCVGLAGFQSTVKLTRKYP
jgi:hypothetical protein